VIVLNKWDLMKPARARRGDGANDRGVREQLVFPTCAGPGRFARTGENVTNFFRLIKMMRKRPDTIGAGVLNRLLRAAFEESRRQ